MRKSAGLSWEAALKCAGFFMFFFSIAILNSVENMIRINQTFIINFQTDFDFVFSIRP